MAKEHNITMEKTSIENQQSTNETEMGKSFLDCCAIQKFMFSKYLTQFMSIKINTTYGTVSFIIFYL